MKLLLVSALFVGPTGTAVHAAPSMTGEISYPKESIGYEALMRGDNERAVFQIMANEQVSSGDPAKLLNLGLAYARMGHTDDAAKMFKAVLESRDSVDLVLADGSVMNSKVAARKAYASLQRRVATR